MLPMSNSSTPKTNHLYRISFYNQGQVFEIYAKSVTSSNLFGFIELSDLVFGEISKVLIDPNEEKLRNEFTDTKRTFIPMHSIIRIDQVSKNTNRKARVLSLANKSKSKKVASTPQYSPIYTPTNPFISE